MDIRRKNMVLVLMVFTVIGFLVMPVIVNAQVSPPGCTANRLSVDISKDKTAIVSGETVNYTVQVSNDPGRAFADECDVSQMTLTFRCPAADGSPTGTLHTLGTDLSFPANTPVTTFPPISCVVTVNPGVINASAMARAGDQSGAVDNLLEGRLHDTETGSPFRVEKLLGIEILPCVVQVDKQVSCDGGTTWVDTGLVSANDDGTFSCNGIVGYNILVRYQAKNAGTANVFNCSITESNSGIGGTVSVGNILSGVTTGFLPVPPRNPICSDTLDDGEPNTATLRCECGAAGSTITASATDFASFACLAPGLSVTKVCETQSENINAISITVQNTGTVGLTDCVVEDNIYLEDRACPVDAGQTGTPVTVAPTSFNLAAGASQTVTGSVSGLTANACNEVSVRCTIAGTTDTITAKADDTCEVPGRGCLTRTPGFWGTHPHITSQFLPLSSCGLDIDTVKAKTEYSATEDLCSTGTDFKAYNTSPQQVQLERQCMAANLNIAATLRGGGDCESAWANITELIAECCNDNDAVCRTRKTGRFISESRCIELLDAFNNLADTLDPYGPFLMPGPADPRECQASRNNGWLNPRPRIK